MSKQKQHFVPQVYLRHFCVGKKRNQIYFYDKISSKADITNVINVAQEKDFYSEISQDDKDRFEKYYSSIVEPTLGVLLNRIISTAVLCTEKTPLLTKHDKHSLSKMLVYQMLRTRYARNLTREKADMISEPFMAQLLKVPEFKKRKDFRAIAEKYRILDDNTLKEISLPLTVDEERLTRYVALIDTMICTFYDNRTEEDFITSDNPVIIKRISTDDIGLGAAGLAHLDSMIFFPITPRLAVVLSHNEFLLSPAFREYENRRWQITQLDIVRTLNKWQFLQSSRQVYSSKPFILLP